MKGLKGVRSNNVVGKNPESLAMSIYFKEVKKFEPLGYEQQIELAIQAKKGNKLAEKRLVETNQRFIISIAKEYRNLGLDIDDLISEGNLGLLRSIDKYDPTRGIKFLSYAVWWIRQSMLQAVYETADTVRLPINKINVLNKINKIRDILSQELNREATFDEVCEKSDFHREEISAVFNGNISVSIEDKVSEGSDVCIIDFIQSDDFKDMESKMSKDSLGDQINEMFSSLTDREAEIVEMYFGLNGIKPMTLKEIGEELNLTNERVRQIKENATKKLRSHSKILKLKEFMGNDA